MSDVVPLPETITGGVTDDAGTLLNDESGQPVVKGSSDAILNAIFAVAKEIRAVSETLSAQVQALTATMVANNASMEAALMAAQADIAALKAAEAGNVTPADVTALGTAVAAQTTHVALAHGLVGTPVAPVA